MHSTWQFLTVFFICVEMYTGVGKQFETNWLRSISAVASKKFCFI